MRLQSAEIRNNARKCKDDQDYKKIFICSSMRSETSGLMSKEIFELHLNRNMKFKYNVGYSMTHSVSNNTVNDELERIWKEVVIA
jgi:hypothetical protein